MPRAVLSAVLLGLTLLVPGTGRAAEPDPSATAEAPPLSQATVDDVTITLRSFLHEPDRTVSVEIAAENQGSLPVRLEAALIALTVVDRSGAEVKRPLDTAGPPLPCGLDVRQRIEFRFTFALKPGDAPQHVSIGIAESNRSGAMVIFPLAPGAGASAIGGSGLAGAPAAGPSVSTPQAASSPIAPAASPEAGGCVN